MRRLITSSACFRNILPDFNFTESETWTDRKHDETTENYKTSLNRTEPEKIILASFPNLILTRVIRSILATTIDVQTNLVENSLKNGTMIFSLTLYECWMILILLKCQTTNWYQCKNTVKATTKTWNNK